MAKSFPWFAVASAAIAGGLLADNVRLRNALNQAASPIPVNATVPGKPRALPAGLAKQTQTAKPRNLRGNAAGKPLNMDRLDDRIDDEVEARLEQAVEARLDTELDAIVAERVDARMAERHERRRARYRAAMEERITEFVVDRDLPPETEAQMNAVMESAMDTIGDLFRSMSDGGLDREDMREELNAIREDVDAALTEVLGENDAALFQDDLRGPLGRQGLPR